MTLSEARTKKYDLCNRGADLFFGISKLLATVLAYENLLDPCFWFADGSGS